MKASDYIVKFLVKQGVHHVFQVIGGAITHLIDSTIDCEKMWCITMHHEQAAGFAAEAYARCNGKLGVAMATSGPGATNLITAIGSCFFDSVPSLFITGQVNTYEYKFDKPVRQIGFQETDIVSIIKPITKGARLITDVNDIPAALEWAVKLAQSGRPGPVLLDIPMNIQRSQIILNEKKEIFDQKNKSENNISSDKLESICQILSKAKRPVILVGGGVRAGQAADELYRFIEQTHIPVVASLMGLDALAHTHPAYVGMIGAYGNRYANITLANADCLLILGSRLDTRQTGTKPDTFAREAIKIHVDIDSDELNRVVSADIALCADIKIFLTQLQQEMLKHTISVSENWLKHIRHCKSKYPSYPLEKHHLEASHEIDANEFMYQLSQEAPENAIIVLDVGQHQMWAAQSFVIKPGQRMLISGGMGSMGFALPAAIGAAFLEPEKEIIVITGDGGLQMNIQELQTIVRNKLTLKIVLMNNQSLGMVRQFQQIYFDGRMEGTVDGYDCPDFIKIFEAYQILAKKVDQKTQTKKMIAALFAEKQSMLLEVMLPQLSRVEPKLVVNHPIEDQDPKLSREALSEVLLIPPITDIPAWKS